jgi:eukaryotic-like serine/threonine-protein kinase
VVLSNGSRLGPYEIVDQVGAGGMGEVYRARDTRLDRTVAIKVLTVAFGENADLKARFEREARSISQLQHPYICTLYDVGHQDGTDFLVMEYLEGETLADRLRRGALPLHQALKVGIEIADALDKAHRAGIVHRDLKPGNIMLTKSNAKLLDFGLAKSAITAGNALDSSAPLLSAALTMTSASPQGSPLTAAGTIVGTVQYMSPEHIEGKAVDSRSDIFSFGAVLYEMVTGRRAFQGKSQLSVASAVLEKDPQPIVTIEPSVPGALDQLTRICLAKEPDERYQSALDVKLTLRAIAAGTNSSANESAHRVGWSAWLGWLVAALILLIGVVGASLGWFQSAKPQSRVALAVLSSRGVAYNFSGLFGPPAISPDGTRIVMGGADNAGTRLLYLRFLDRTTLLPLQGTTGASYPFWSPDGKRIGFFTSSSLKVIDVGTGSVSEVCAVQEGRGGTWNARGEIVYGTRTTGLLRVNASGGQPVPVTKLNPKEANHRFPIFFPDGDHLAFVAQTVGGSQAQVTSVTKQQPIVLQGVVSNMALREGRLFHVRPDGTLLAQLFDLKRYALLPEAEVVAKPVGYDGQFAYAAFSVSDPGTIAYEEGSGSTANEIVLFDRSGKQVGQIPGMITESSGQGLRISPKGDRLLYSAYAGLREDLWVQSTSGMRSRLTLGPVGGANGIWSPDGSEVAYQNGLAGDSLLIRSSDGKGGERVVLKMEGEVIPRGWSPDGHYIVCEFHAVANPNSLGEIWIVPLKPGQQPHALVRNVVNYGTDLSPDGKWLAYTSNESGRLELYVLPFDANASADSVGATGRWQISTDGGDQPRWSPRSDELFFTNPSRTTLYVAAIKAPAGKFESGSVHKLFDLPLHPAWSFYDIGLNGNIYMFRYVGRQSSPLTILLNWKPEVK